MSEAPKPHEDYNRFIPPGRVMQWMSRAHVWVYRLSGGRVGGAGDKLKFLLLTSTGRKTGKTRTTPLPYFEFDAYPTSYFSVGSNGGRDQHAAWYHNVTANPEVEIQVGSRKLRANARIAEGDERALLWKQITALQPRYEDYQQTTERQIPVAIFDVA